MQKPRTTAQKLELRRFFEANRDREMTVAEISEELAESGSEIGIATVYRAVKRLESEGVLQRSVDGIKSKAKYRYVGETSVRSSHMIFCQCCGKTLSISLELSTRFEGMIADKTGFVITDHQLLLYGRCPDCK